MAGGNPYLQDVTPTGAPDPVTPQASPGDQAGWDQVSPTMTGQAPYDISAPQDIAGIQGAFEAASNLTGAGVLYPRGPRQAEAEAFLQSPAGAGAMNVLAGYSPDSDTPNDVSPGADMANPIQGMDAYPGTTQSSVQQYAGDAGPMEGLTPETGSMGGGPGIGYPGTTQDGVPTYGT